VYDNSTYTNTILGEQQDLAAEVVEEISRRNRRQQKKPARAEDSNINTCAWVAVVG